MANDYPEAWRIGSSTREQREVIGQAGGVCELRYAGCTNRASTIWPPDLDPAIAASAACHSCRETKASASSRYRPMNQPNTRRNDR